MSDKNNNSIKSEYKFFTIEFFGVTLIITTLLLFVCLLFGRDILFELGEVIQFFLLGVFGYLAYPLLISLNYVGIMLLIGRRIVKDANKTAIKKALIILFVFVCLLNIITSKGAIGSYSEYLLNAYSSAKGGIETAYAGGIIFSLVTYPFVKYLTYIGGIICVSLILCLTVYLTLFKKRKNFSNGNAGYDTNESYNGVGASQGYTQQPYYQPPVGNYSNGYTQPEYQGMVSGGNNQQSYQTANPQPAETPQTISEEPVKDEREKNRELLFGNANGTAQNYSESYNENFTSDLLSIKQTMSGHSQKPLYDLPKTVKKDFDQGKYESTDSAEKTDVVSIMDGDDETNSNDVVKNYFRGTKDKEQKDSEVNISEETTKSEKSKTPVFSKGDQLVLDDDSMEKIYVQPNIIENMPDNYRYIQPPASLFTVFNNDEALRNFELFKNKVAATIIQTYKDFDLDITIARVLHGPTVTRFDIELPRGISISKLVRYNEDVNLRIAAVAPVRILAPVQNTSYIGIEVPNDSRELVGLKDILLSDKFKNSDPQSLTCALGKDTVGNPVVLNIVEAPHVLLTGATGSGKSVTLNVIILSLISKYSPSELRMIIVDAKVVGFKKYLGVPHLLFNHVIEDLPECNSMLGWAVDEMNRRYKVLDSVGVDSIKKYNAIAKREGRRPMYRLVIIIDEFSDLMLQDSKGIAPKICLLVQKARACGIHLILSAQRPDSKVVEGGIKSNVPTRVVLLASTLQDSQISLGETGAEKLNNNGDCLFKKGGSTPERIQCAFSPDEELERVIKFIVDNNEAYYDLNTYSTIKANCSAASSETTGSTSSQSGSSGSERVTPPSVDTDPLVIHALQIAIDTGSVSITHLQRKLAIGFSRAAKFVDWMAENHYISEVSKGGKREVYITQEEFDMKYGDSSNK